MTDIAFSAMPAHDASHFWRDGADAYGLRPETHISTGPGTPCRHCLNNIDAGQPYFILAYRPFPALQPYAETGPIFLHAKPCKRYETIEVLPPVLTSSQDFIVRGYGLNDRIAYGSGAVTESGRIAARAQHLFENSDIAYIHVRSARYNCFQCRIDRKEAPLPSGNDASI